MKKLFVATAIVALILSLVIGVQFWQRSNYEYELQKSQAVLAFSHWSTYEKLTEYLSNGCRASSQAMLERALELQEMLMAQFVQEYKDIEFEEYVELREPGLSEELSEKVLDWGMNWTIPKCVDKIPNESSKRDPR